MTITTKSPLTTSPPDAPRTLLHRDRLWFAVAAASLATLLALLAAPLLTGAGLDRGRAGHGETAPCAGVQYTPGGVCWTGTAP